MVDEIVTDSGFGPCTSSQHSYVELPEDTRGTKDHKEKWDAIVWLGDFNSRLQEDKKDLDIERNKDTTKVLIDKGLFDKMAN